MNDKKRVSRSRSDLLAELKDQVQLLEHHCATYDSGMEAVAKHIAAVLSVLLHHRGLSRSLLEQLGLRTGYFKSSASPFRPSSLLPIHTLVALRMHSGGVSYAPNNRPAVKSVPFAEWWNAPVVRDGSGRLFSRREIVSHVRNTDGGAHVDPGLDEAYMDFSRNNSLGWFQEQADGSEIPIQGRPEMACIRQIASEMLTTLRRKAPELFESAA